VLLAVAGSLLGPRLAQRITTKRVYLVGLAASLTAMALLLVSALVKADQAIAYPLLLIDTAFVGAGFGLTVSVLNVYAAVFHPAGVDSAVLVLNALLGLGTVLAGIRGDLRRAGTLVGPAGTFRGTSRGPAHREHAVAAASPN